MRNYMARLGSFTFSISTAAFQELQRASTYRWEAKNRIGRKPAQQNVGQGADTIELSGTIYPHYRGGLGQMAKLRAMAESGEAVPLVYAFETAGQYCGLWCITSINETRTVFFDNGGPRRIDFQISLTQYGEDASANPLVQVAMIAGAPVVSTVDAVGAASAAASVAKEAQSVTSQSGALSMIGRAVSVAQDVSGNVSTAVSAVLNSDAVRLARTGITEFQNLKAAAAGLSSAVRSVEGIISNPATATAALGNLSASAGGLSDVLSSASTKLGLKASDLNGSSSSSLHKLQISSATETMSQLAKASASLRSMSDSLRGFF